MQSNGWGAPPLVGGRREARRARSAARGAGPLVCARLLGPPHSSTLPLLLVRNLACLRGLRAAEGPAGTARLVLAALRLPSVRSASAGRAVIGAGEAEAVAGETAGVVEGATHAVSRAMEDRSNTEVPTAPCCSIRDSEHGIREWARRSRRVPAIVEPFGDVAHDVVQTPAVRLFPANRMRSAIGVDAVPRDGVKSLVLQAFIRVLVGRDLPRIERRPRPRPR